MNLSELLLDKSKTFLLDGAMGTQLALSGSEMGGLSNLSNPDAVLAVHGRYVESGADLLITNTFTMNRVNVEAHGMGVDITEVNLAGVRLAKTAAGSGRYVLGDMGSTGRMLKPHGDVTEEIAYAAFREQALILAAGGVDGIGYGVNTAAGLITRGLAEMTRLTVACGGRAETMSGLAGVGDLVLTCTGGPSRNRSVGGELGRGRKLDEIIAGMHGMVAEGVLTTSAAMGLARSVKVEMPIIEQMDEILQHGKNPSDAIRDLMNRPLTKESALYRD